jgi:PAS domain S-box-containing protein
MQAGQNFDDGSKLTDMIQKITDRAYSGDPDKIKPCIELLLHVVEGSSQPFVIADAYGKIKGCNMAYCRLTGYSSEELLSKKCGEDLTPPEWRQKEAEVVAAQIKTKMPAIYIKEYVRKDGSRVAIELYDHIIFDNKDAPIYFYAFVTDVSLKYKK